MRHAFATMGTVVSLAGDLDEGLVENVLQVFESADRRFSRYRDDSELSAVVAGRIALTEASPELRECYAAAMDWRSRTGGSFTPNRPDGTIDLDGIVKSQAMAEAGEVLKAAGIRWSLAVGGDVVVAPDLSDDDDLARIGIVDPADRSRLLTRVVLRGSRRAVATSGSAERGDHIWLRDRVGVPDFVQATVVADDIVTADVLATAIISGGSTALDEIADRWDVDILTVDRDGELLATPGMREAIAVPALS